MSVTTDNTISVWVPEEESKLVRDVNEFKRKFNYENSADRTVSELSRRWIRTGLKADQLMEDSSMTIENDREFASFVAEAVREKIEREQQSD